MIQPISSPSASPLPRTLGQNQQASDRATTRLATGLRLNSGKDGPADLISSERLRSILEALDAESAVITRQDQVANAADGFLAEGSRLQSENRALEVQLADSTRSQAERDAIQFQLDSNNQAIDRIGQTASFNGQRLFSGDTTLALGETSITLPTIDANTDSATLATLRGEIGAYQSNTLDSAQRSNRVAAEQTAAATSNLRDTDFAEELVNLRSAQLRTEANFSALAVTNATRSRVLDLLA
ncbi:MAG: flagellin [Planctomycetota bacterium]